WLKTARPLVDTHQPRKTRTFMATITTTPDRMRPRTIMERTTTVVGAAGVRRVVSGARPKSISRGTCPHGHATGRRNRCTLFHGRLSAPAGLRPEQFRIARHNSGNGTAAVLTDAWLLA